MLVFAIKIGESTKFFLLNSKFDEIYGRKSFILTPFVSFHSHFIAKYFILMFRWYDPSRKRLRNSYTVQCRCKLNIKGKEKTAMSSCTVSSHCRHKCDRRKCEGFEAGAAWSRGIFGWSRSRHFGPAPAPPSVCACKNRFIKIISPTTVKKDDSICWRPLLCNTHQSHTAYTIYIIHTRVKSYFIHFVNIYTNFEIMFSGAGDVSFFSSHS